MGRGNLGSLWSNLLPKAALGSDKVAQGFLQPGLEHLQAWRWHEQSMLGYPKNFFPLVFFFFFYPIACALSLSSSIPHSLCFLACFANEERAFFQLPLGSPGWLSQLCDTLQLSCKPPSEKPSLCGHLLRMQKCLSSTGAGHAFAGG